MTLSVIGSGFGRTGTMSLKLALEQLGLGPCYHMVEVFKNPAAPDWWSACAFPVRMTRNLQWRPFARVVRARIDGVTRRSL